MEWNKIEPSSREYPERIVMTTIAGFSKATEELVELVVVPMSSGDRFATHLDNDFLFNVYLRSPLVTNYKLKVLSFGYNVELAPIIADIEDTIYESTFQQRKTYQKTIISKDGDNFKQMLEQIFRCSRFIEIVRGVMKIAAKNRK